jgi:hypothetical protein
MVGELMRDMRSSRQWTERAQCTEVLATGEQKRERSDPGGRGGDEV